MPDRLSTVAVRDPGSGVPDDALVAAPGLLRRIFVRLRRLARFAYDLLIQSP
jgi:hypothetical protein